MQHAHSSLGHETVPWCIPRGYEVTKPPFLCELKKIRFIIRIWNIYLTFTDKPPGEQKMNLSFTFSIREISEVKDSDQVGTVYYIFCSKYIIHSVQNILYILSRI